MIPLSDANARTRFPFVNLTIIAINLVVYYYSTTLGGYNLSENTPGLLRFFYTWAVVPAEYTQGESIGPTPTPVFLTLFTAMFMHGSLLHLVGNMLFLWVFGDNVEGNMGHVKYLIFYLVSGVLASAAHILFTAFGPGSEVPSLGASGAIAGVLAAYMVLFPRAQVRTLIFIVIFFTVTRVSALLLIGIWFVLQFLQGIGSLGGGATDGVAVWAHVGGFIAGFLLVFLFRGPRKRFTGRDYLPGGPTGYSG